MTQKSENFEKTIVQVDSLMVYEVKEEELDILKEGPNIKYGWLFDLFIFFIGIGITQLIALWSGLGPQDMKKQIILYSGSLGCCLIGIIILLLRIFVKKENKFEQIYKKIIERHTIS